MAGQRKRYSAELKTKGTAIHCGGQFGPLSHSLDNTGDSPYPSL